MTDRPTSDRRAFLAAGGSLALLGLASCAAPAPPPAEPAGPAVATVTATGARGMNPGPDGAERPITLTVLQLRAPTAFQGADFFALQSPAGVLGADLVSSTQVTVAPGGSAQVALTLDPATTAIGVVAGFRDPAGKTFRAVAPVAPGQSVALAVAVTPAGVSIAAA